MTDTINNSLDYEDVIRLLENSVCLTYNPLESTSAFLYIKDMQKQSGFRYNRILSKKSKFFVSKHNPDFHYFADGTLIHHCCVKDGIFNVNDHKKLQRIYNLLKINNMPIVREYCPSTQLDYFKYSELLRFISEQALINYSYKTDLYIEELPDLDVFIQECFDNNNILLTASKYEILPSDLRSDLAIFAGGKVFVSENCKKELNSNKNENIRKLLFEYSNNFILSEVEYVPQYYIDALYKKAEDFDWFLSSEDYKKSEYINNQINLFFNNNSCLTVTNPNFQNKELNPDISRYAVFSNGLVVSSIYNENSEMFVKELKSIFNNKELHFLSVSDECINQLYERLPEFQKSAATIYIEILKQKARKLKRLTGEQHSKMLDLVAKEAGWKNWQSVKIESEKHARLLIDEEKQRSIK